ncbi:MAG TPA: hypothetical protein VGV59_11105 [Pyrinomonadaceae bacterium]|nr:hypothetical protein [Pyrinomonadaceae bacterium]
MKTIKCPSCQLPNNFDNEACEQCHEPLAAAKLEQTINELRATTEKAREAVTPRKSFSSLNGFGTTLLDYRALDDGTYEATRWVIAMALPLFPLATYRIRPETQERGYGQETSRFTILERVALKPARIVRTYLLAAVGLLPVLLGIIYSTELNRVLKGWTAVLVMLLMGAWAVYIIFFKLKNEGNAYKTKPAVQQQNSRITT